MSKLFNLLLLFLYDINTYFNIEKVGLFEEDKLRKRDEKLYCLIKY